MEERHENQEVIPETQIVAFTRQAFLDLIHAPYTFRNLGYTTSQAERIVGIAHFLIGESPIFEKMRPNRTPSWATFSYEATTQMAIRARLLAANSYLNTYKANLERETERIFDSPTDGVGQLLRLRESMQTQLEELERLRQEYFYHAGRITAQKEKGVLDEPNLIISQAKRQRGYEANLRIFDIPIQLSNPPMWLGPFPKGQADFGFILLDGRASLEEIAQKFQLYAQRNSNLGNFIDNMKALTLGDAHERVMAAESLRESLIPSEKRVYLIIPQNEIAFIPAGATKQ